MKVKIIIIISFIYNLVYSQENLNVLISVDNIVTGSYNISDSFLIIKQDTVSLKYEMGRFSISNNDFKILKQHDRNENVKLNFNYHQSCPEQKLRTYIISFKVNFLLQEYFYISVFNYDSFPKAFTSSHGYGFEYKSPLESRVIPKNKKYIHNKCLE